MKADALKIIGDNCCADLDILESFSFPDNGLAIEQIGNNFLCNAIALNNLNNFFNNISSLTKVGNNFLSNVSILSVNLFEATALKSIGSGFLKNSNATMTIDGTIILPKSTTPPTLAGPFEVGEGTVYINNTAYKTTANWSNAASSMQMNMTLTNTATTGKVGNEIDPIATINNPIYQNDMIEWTSSNTTYAEIVSGYESTISGQATKISLKAQTPTGTTIRITATTPHFTQSFIINSISPAGVTEINIEQSTINCLVNDTIKNKATINASAGSGVQIIWQVVGSSANCINVLTRTTKPGEEASFQIIDKPANDIASIKASAGGIDRQFTVFIKYREVTNVEINGESKLIGRQGDAGSTKYDATINPGANPAVTWSFSDQTKIPSWLKIDAKTGLLSWTTACEKGIYSFDIKVASSIKESVIATKPCVLEIHDAKPTPPSPAHVDENSTWLFWLILAGGIALIFFASIVVLSSILYRKHIRK